MLDGIFCLFVVGLSVLIISSFDFEVGGRAQNIVISSFYISSFTIIIQKLLKRRRLAFYIDFKSEISCYMVIFSQGNTK